MIEVNETQPVEASLTIRVTGEDVGMLKSLLETVAAEGDFWVFEVELANRLLEGLS